MRVTESKTQLGEAELKELSHTFEEQSPQDILTYALTHYFPEIVLACSFGAEDVVLLDMMHRINPHVPLFYLDTEFLFSETYDVRDRVIAKYRLSPEQVIRVTSMLSPEEQAKQYGAALWFRRPDECCHLRKVEPLSRTLQSFSAWVTGIRRDQAPARAQAGCVEWDAKFQLVKFNPLVRWTTEDIWSYIRTHEVPYNILHDEHYPSIGCTHCTGPVMPGKDPRSGRWQSSEKTECGLHQ